ncbi:MAG: DNA double-strand break repair nuclease NurA [Zestosphaera sp.]
MMTSSFKFSVRKLNWVYVIPIHDLLIEELSSAVNDLLGKINPVDSLTRYLRNIGVYPIRTSELGEPVDVVAGDSSRVAKKLSLAVIYAVQATSLKASLKSHSPSRLVVKSLAGYHAPTSKEVVPHELIDRILQLISRALEVKSVTELLDNDDVALFDGSLISFLWGYTKRGMPRGFYPSYYNRIKDIWHEVFSGITNALRRAKPLFIAKTPMRNYYVDILLSSDAPREVREGVNDLVLIKALRKSGRLPKTPHILEPVYVGREDLPRPLNVLDVNLDVITPITVTYVTFNTATQPYQLSIPGKLDVKELVELVSKVYPYSLSGYPDPLKVAHNKCKITNVEFRTLLYKLGLSSVPTGRELLGEFL